IASADLARVDSLGRLPGETWYGFQPEMGGPGFFRPPHFPNAQVFAAGDYMYAGDTDRAEVRVFTSDGTPTQLVRWRGMRRALSDDDMRLAMDALVAQAGPDSAGARAVMNRIFRDLPVSDSMPAFGRLRA